MLGAPGKCSISFGVEQTAEFYSAVISTAFNSYLKIGDFSQGLIIPTDLII